MLVDESFGALTEAECRARLGTASVGRVAITIGALPAIRPVRYACVGDDLVFGVGDEPALRAALDGSVVAFEVDHHDDARGAGWSVQAVGTARVVAEPDEADRLLAAIAGSRGRRAAPAAPAGPAGASPAAVVRLHPELLSGRRLRDPEFAAT